MNIKDKFEQPITDWPESIKVKADGVELELPTIEIWKKGDWLARRFSGIHFDLIDKALKLRGINAKRILVK